MIDQSYVLLRPQDVSLTEPPSVREASKGLAGLAAEPAFSAGAEVEEPAAVAQFDEDAIAADFTGGSRRRETV